jgi:hypothetical protein
MLELWDSAKCLRLLRPLKLKIVALQRALASSQSVADGLTSWKDLSSSSMNPLSDQSGVDFQSKSRARMAKYGSRRNAIRQAAQPFPSTADALLAQLRQGMSPHLYTAFLGVFEAYKGMLERSHRGTTKLSLASRSAFAVGKCVVLTSESMTDSPIDADDWYESTPAHLRTSVMLGQACQMLISHAEMLAPILPALALCTAPSPLSRNIFNGLLAATSFTGSKRLDIQALRRHATQLHYPQLLQRHYAGRFAHSYFDSANLSLLTMHETAEALDEDTFALYKIMTRAGCDTQRLENEGSKDTIIDALTGITQRTIRFGSEMALSYMADLYANALNRSSGMDEFQLLGIAHKIALLEHQPNSQLLRQSLQKSFREVYQSDRKTEHIATLAALFGESQIITLVELLVGRVDQMAVMLAYEAATQHGGEFIHWANEVERSVMEAKAGSDSGRWRFEPLLESWVASTPGVRQVRGDSHRKRRADEEQDDAILSEADYEGDTSEQILHSANQADDKDLISPFQMPAKPIDQAGLSVVRLQDLQSSAKVLKRYKQRSFESCGMSPLIKRTQPGTKHLLDDCDLMSSPIQTTRKKARLGMPESLPVAEDCHSGGPEMASTRTSRAQARHARVTSEIPESRDMRPALRELINLKSSFLSLRKKKAVQRPERRVPKMAKTPLRRAVYAEELSSGYESASPRALSETDELSLL